MTKYPNTEARKERQHASGRAIRHSDLAILSCLGVSSLAPSAFLALLALEDLNLVPLGTDPDDVSAASRRGGTSFVSSGG